MKRLLGSVVLGLAALSTAAAASSLQRSFSVSAPVIGLAGDNSITAFAVGARPRDCRHVAIWNRSSRAVVRLGNPHPCGPVTSTGSGLVGPSVAGTRALWLTYTGGNIREWSLWTATTTMRQPKRLQFVARDVDAAPPIVLGEGNSGTRGYLLPYTIDRKLYSMNDRGRSVLYLSAAERIVAVTASGGLIAAALESGPVVILDGPSRVVRTEPFTKAVDAVRIAGGALVAQQGRVLALRSASGARAWTLPPGSKLADADGSLAVYVRGHELHLFGLATGKDVIFRRTSATPLAQLEPAGLVYSVGRTITFVPRTQLNLSLR